MFSNPYENENSFNQDGTTRKRVSNEQTNGC